MQTIDLLGQTFGYWTVIERAPEHGGPAKWLCQCRCGNQAVLISSDLRRGHTKSCGCGKREAQIRRNTTHGLAPRGRNRSPTYIAWANMLQRIRDAGRHNAAAYAGRGITICNRWQQFENFLEDMGERPPGLSLDRIDNDGHYEPGNCRWASTQQQARNTQQVRWIDFDGERLCLMDWAKRLELPYLTLFMRLKHGWSVHRAFTTPVRPRRRSS